MTTPDFSGVMKFKIKAQDKAASGVAALLDAAIQQGVEPPESLRFRCRIAEDSRDNFEGLNLPDGTRLRVHDRSKPQFGKNSAGLAFLTVTVEDVATGEAYCLRWQGDAVPERMVRTAVRHDRGLGARAAVVDLDLSRADVKPAHKVQGTAHRSERDYEAEDARRAEMRAGGVSPKPRTKRKCSRMTGEDLALNERVIR